MLTPQATLKEAAWRRRRPLLLLRGLRRKHRVVNKAGHWIRTLKLRSLAATAVDAPPATTPSALAAAGGGGAGVPSGGPRKRGRRHE